MTQPTSLPGRTTEDTVQEHLDDHAALHALYSAMGGRFGARLTAGVVTPSLAAGASWTGDLTMAPSYRLLKLEASAACRVRIYATAAARTADAARAAGTDPADGAGVILDYVFTAAGTATLLLSGFQDEAVPSGAVPVSVTNTGAAPATLTVTATYQRTE